MKNKLSEKKKRLLREFVSFNCEECGKNEKEVGTLWIHRIHRGYLNGEYCLRNIKLICHKCSKRYHYREFK